MVSFCNGIKKTTRELEKLTSRAKHWETTLKNQHMILPFNLMNSSITPGLIQLDQIICFFSDTLGVFAGTT